MAWTPCYRLTVCSDCIVSQHNSRRCGETQRTRRRSPAPYSTAPVSVYCLLNCLYRLWFSLLAVWKYSPSTFSNHMNFYFIVSPNRREHEVAKVKKPGSLQLYRGHLINYCEYHLCRSRSRTRLIRTSSKRRKTSGLLTSMGASRQLELRCRWSVLWPVRVLLPRAAGVVCT